MQTSSHPFHESTPKPSVLLVDDEPNIPRAIQRALRNEGYSIFTAHSAHEAIACIDSRPIDVIVSDHRMPGMTGAELLAEVNRTSPATVRIMLSGQADLSDVIKAVNEGSIYKFFTKPWSNDILRATIREAVVMALAGAPTTEKTSYHTSHARCLESLRVIDQSALVIALEVRNGTALRSVSESQMHELRKIICERITSTCAPMLTDLQQIDANLFAFGMQACAAEQVGQLAENLTQSYVVDDTVLPLRIAAGFTECNDLAAEDSLSQALVALTATSFARETTAFTTNISQANHERHSLELDMRQGLDNNEFFLQVQPQVSGSTLKIAGAECLCRWRHPRRGLISPLQFIDLAERTGFIDSLGQWVLRASCDYLDSLPRPNGIKISFNVSPRQFSDPGWPDAIFNFAQSEGFKPERLEVEITESTVMSNPTHALEVIGKLKSIGVSIAMDDFGTGHSSLGLISDLPLDTLKFDRSLIERVTDDPKSRRLFAKLVELAHELGLNSVAEGVETHDQVQLCQDLKCDLIQGFYFYPPVSLTEFTELIG